MRPAVRLSVIDIFGERPRRRKGRGDLIVQLGAVGDDHEGEVATQTPQHLLGEHHHRKRLPGSLSMPEHSQPPLVILQVSDSFDRPIDTKHLVVFADDIAQTVLAFLE